MTVEVPELTRDDVLAMTPEQRVGLLRMMMPRIIEPYVPHAPHAPQALFLLDQGKEAFYGGAAGGGKSDALLMAALQYIDVPRYSALILRRTWGDLSQPGAIMERTEDWLGDTDAKPHDGGRYWTFPSGARLTFNFVQYPRDVTKFKSAEFQMIGWDELTNFTESSYTFMFSRLRRPALGCEDCPVKVEKVRPGQRSTSPAVRQDGTDYLIGGREVADETGWVHSVGQSNYKARCDHPAPARRAMAEYPPSENDGHTTLFDVPLRMRSASNPGDVGHEWVRDRFVDPERRRRSASFYPARLTDNPSLDQASYEAGLSELDPVERQRLLDGDWDVAADGVMFKRSWFEVVSPDAVPAGCKLMRYWDFAATKVKTTGDKNDPDWTCGVLVGLFEGVWYIIDMVRIREDPHAVERTVASTASQDGSRVPIRIEQEPGSSGKITIDHYRRNVLVGYNVDKLRPTTAKEERARLWASAAGAGNVKIVGGDWNRAFIDELAIFPYGTHDDQIDSVSGAVECLVGKRPGRILV